MKEQVKNQEELEKFDQFFLILLSKIGNREFPTDEFKIYDAIVGIKDGFSSFAELEFLKQRKIIPKRPYFIPFEMKIVMNVIDAFCAAGIIQVDDQTGKYRFKSNNDKVKADVKNLTEKMMGDELLQFEKAAELFLNKLNAN